MVKFFRYSGKNFNKFTKSAKTADRAAQGITAEQEAAAEQAIAQREIYVDGRLILIRLPHARTATVTDRLQPHL